MSKKVLNLLKVFLTFVFVVSMFACTLTVNFASADSAPLMVDGGSIRYQAQGNAGIRFSAYVPDSLFDDIATKDLKDNVSVGMYLIPETNVGDGVTEIDGQTAGVTKISPTVWVTSDKVGYQQYNVVVKGIPEANYATQILASSFIKDGEDEQVSSTVIRSIANVANTLLAWDTLVDENAENKLDTDQITELGEYLSATETLGDVDVTILDGVAKWSAVENATMYIVKTENGIFKTTATKYNLDCAGSVSVIACGDGVSATCSAVDTTVAHELSELQLATFNDESYIEDLVAGSETMDNFDFSSSKEVHTSSYSRKFYKGNGSDQKETPPAFADGVASFGLGVTAYHDLTLGTSVFTINLQKSLDLTSHKGIKIRLMFDSFTNDPDGGIGELTFKLANPAVKNSTTTALRRQYGYVIPNANNSYIGGAEISATAGEWIDWEITNEQLSNFYSNGDNKLVISFFTANTFAKTQIRTAYFKIDDISYYGVGVPTNLTINGKVISWGAVVGADKYVIDVNGVPYETTETTYDLSSVLGTTATIKVKAVGGEGESDYCQAIEYVASSESVLFDFDDSTDASSIGLGNNAAIKPVSGYVAEDYEYTVEYVENEGALYMLPIITRYVSQGGARLALFTITLPEALSGLDDGTKDGISITLKLGDIIHGTSGGSATKQIDNYTLVLIKNGYSIAKDNEYRATGAIFTNENYATTTIAKGDYNIWKISAETLSSLSYVDGVTQLTFGVLTETSSSETVSVDTTGNGGYCVETYIDKLSYYMEED